MSRPLRLEFAGALYHITSRGNGRNLINAGVTMLGSDTVLRIKPQSD
jgi:hypothetical protein